MSKSKKPKVEVVVWESGPVENSIWAVTLRIPPTYYELATCLSRDTAEVVANRIALALGCSLRVED